MSESSIDATLSMDDWGVDVEYPRRFETFDSKVSRIVDLLESSDSAWAKVRFKNKSLRIVAEIEFAGITYTQHPRVMDIEICHSIDQSNQI
jgi:hypothetical protein